jgi:hypothetical protein
MPVTAKLSRKFYDTFGDELTNELVEVQPGGFQLPRRSA